MRSIWKSKTDTRHKSNFFLSGFSFTHWRHWWLTWQQGKGGYHLLFRSTTSTRSQTFRHLFATLHVRWLSHIFYLPDFYSMRFTALSNFNLTDWWCDVNFCLFTWWFDSRLLLEQFDTWYRWTRTLIDYHPCITANRLPNYALFSN